jgi:heterodisulfide reductase subunit B
MEVTEDPEKLKTINEFMYLEDDYKGGVMLVHLLELFRDEIGFDAIAKKVLKPLRGLKVAPYYGCTLTRPKKLPSMTGKSHG